MPRLLAFLLALGLGVGLAQAQGLQQQIPVPLSTGMGGTGNATGAIPAASITSGTMPAARMPALTGDCTSSAGAVSTTCTKTSGVSFAPSATTDTTDATNISAGVLAVAQGGTGSATGALKIPSAAVGSLPTCNGGTAGTLYLVTNALTPIALATVAGGGAVVVAVVCTGAAWIVL